MDIYGHVIPPRHYHINININIPVKTLSYYWLNPYITVQSDRVLQGSDDTTITSDCVGV